jgi:hypothetical protein
MHGFSDGRVSLFVQGVLIEFPMSTFTPSTVPESMLLEFNLFPLPVRWFFSALKQETYRHIAKTKA